jgi:uncharacterized protein
MTKEIKTSALTILIFVASCAAAVPSFSASFDCAKASTKIEKLICSTPAINKLDTEMAAIYKDAVQREPSAKDGQRTWIQERNKCQDAACLEEAYKERSLELTNIIIRADREELAKTNNTEIVERPPYPLAYGKCYGALMAQMKQTDGKLASQKAVEFFNTWASYAQKNADLIKKSGGCSGNLTNSQLLACYKKTYSDQRDAHFQYNANLGFEEVIGKPASAANLTIANICGPLIGVRRVEPNSTENAPQPNNSSGSGVVTRVDTSTGNVFISGFSPWVPTNRATSITVNGSQVRNEGDLMPGDKCSVRREPSDLYARNLICSR